MERPRGFKLAALFWDRIAAVAWVVIAVVMLVVGWFSLSAETEAGDQIPYIMSAGIGGLFLLSIGIALWISSDLRDEWRKLDVIDERLRHLTDAGVLEEAAPESEVR